MITKVADVAVVVSDARKAAEWFREKLGFVVGGEAEGHWVVVHPAGGMEGTRIHLCADIYPLEPGNTGIGFSSDDLAEDIRVLKSRGVEFTVEPSEGTGEGYAMFKDPEGNEFWLYE